MNSHALIADAASPRMLLRQFATAGCVVVALAFLTYWPSYSYLVLGGRSPLYYYMIPGFVAVPLLFLQPGAPLRLLNEPVLWWFVCYVMLGMAWLLLAQDFPNQAGHQWRMRVLASFFFCTILLMAVLARLPYVALAIVGCILFSGALNWYDAIYPARLVPLGFPGSNPGRGAGWFINANGAAAFALMASIAVLPFTPMRLRALLLLVAVLAVAPTFSRFGWIFAVLLVLMAIGLGLLDRRQVLLIVCTIPVLLAGAGLYYEFVLRSDNENVLSRLAWFQSFGDRYDFSMRERAYVAQQAWERFLDSPLYGHGIGVTLSRGARVGTHNMYVMMMAEQGIVGLALYASLIGLLLHKGWHTARAAGSRLTRDVGRATMIYASFLALYGFVNHDVLSEPHGMFILAFMLGACIQLLGLERASGDEGR